MHALLPRSLAPSAIVATAIVSCGLAFAACSSDGASSAPSDAGGDATAHDADAAIDAPHDVLLFPKDDGGAVDVGPPPSCTGGFGPSVACGMTDKLTWSCANATTCSYDCTGTITATGAIPCAGSADLAVGAAGEHCTIHATGPAGSATASANAACAGMPACSATFSGCGDTSTISWSCSDATSCSYACSGTVSAGGAVACSGSTPFAVGLAGETCTITATGTGGTGSTTVTATCLPPSCTGSFAGCSASSSVTWDCQRATSCTFDCTGSVVASGSLACSGTTPFAVGAAGESCVITATGPGGTGSTTATASCP